MLELVLVPEPGFELVLELERELASTPDPDSHFVSDHVQEVEVEVAP